MFPPVFVWPGSGPVPRTFRTRSRPVFLYCTSFPVFFQHYFLRETLFLPPNAPKAFSGHVCCSDSPFAVAPVPLRTCLAARPRKKPFSRLRAPLKIGIRRFFASGQSPIGKIFGGYLQVATLKSSGIVLFDHTLKIHPFEFLEIPLTNPRRDAIIYLPTEPPPEFVSQRVPMNRGAQKRSGRYDDSVRPRLFP